MRSRWLSLLVVSSASILALSCSQKSQSAERVAAKAPELSYTELTNHSLVRKGVFVLPRLSGEAALTESNTLLRLRHVPKTAGFEPRTFTERTGPRESLRYLLFKPSTTNASSLPLVLSLHGGGPRRELAHLLEPFAPGFAYGLGRLVAPETQREHPCFVVAPWSDNRGWDARNQRLVLALLDSLQREFPIDSNRIYVTGQSMGGFGTWAILATAPERFAAAIPICGGGEPSTAPLVKQIPIWALHGSGDQVVPVSNTREMILALQGVGGTPIYWEYGGATHAETAERAYCEPELLNWLFAQRLRR